jgi:alkylhydroperoxidase family enzyme
VPSTFRIPKAELTGPYARLLVGFTKRTFGEVPDPAYTMFHHKPILKATLAFERKVAKWDRLDSNLKAYAEMAAAATVGCGWCMDFGYWMANHEGLDIEKLRQVPVWRDSDAFTDLERDVLEYAEAMSTTPLGVTDWMVDKLTDQLGVEAVVELTKMISVENERARFNAALGLASQGFADSCSLAPLAR